MRRLERLSFVAAILVFGCAKPENQVARRPIAPSASTPQSEAPAPRFQPGALPPGVNAPTPTPGQTWSPARPGSVAMTPEEYGPRLKAILTPIRQPMLKVHDEQDATRLPAELDASAAAVSNAANALRALTPPVGAEMVNQTFVGWLEETAGIYGTMAADLRTGQNSSHTDKGAYLDSAYQNFSGNLKAALQAGGWDETAFAEDPPRLVKVTAPATTG